jgi:glycosyltransferase involved in cell wall biosynthesis
MINGKTVSIITRFRDREKFLMQVLPSWLLLPVDQILIIDWDSKNVNIEEYLYEINDWRIKLIKVYEQPFFQRSAAWNWGILHSSTDWLLLIDGDVEIVHNLFLDQKIDLSANAFYHPGFTLNADGFRLFGTCLVSRQAIFDAGGYNEGLKDWGWEDQDVYNRLSKSGVKEVFLNVRPFHHIEHDDDFRTEAHKSRNIILTRNKNMYRCLNVKSIKFDETYIGKVIEIGKMSSNIFATYQIIEHKIHPDIIELIVKNHEFEEWMGYANDFFKTLKGTKFDIFNRRPDSVLSLIGGLT